jgi:hypothetical protein
MANKENDFQRILGAEPELQKFLELEDTLQQQLSKLKLFNSSSTNEYYSQIARHFDVVGDHGSIEVLKMFAPLPYSMKILQWWYAKRFSRPERMAFVRKNGISWLWALYVEHGSNIHQLIDWMKSQRTPKCPRRIL